MSADPAAVACIITDQSRLRSLLFYCPGCRSHHAPDLKPEGRWEFNGDLVCPTIAPSLLINGHGTLPGRCHSFIRNGEIQFLGDCDHELAGQTVKLEPVEWS